MDIHRLNDELSNCIAQYFVFPLHNFHFKILIINWVLFPLFLPHISIISLEFLERTTEQEYWIQWFISVRLDKKCINGNIEPNVIYQWWCITFDVWSTISSWDFPHIICHILRWLPVPSFRYSFHSIHFYPSQELENRFTAIYLFLLDFAVCKRIMIWSSSVQLVAVNRINVWS